MERYAATRLWPALRAARAATAPKARKKRAGPVSADVGASSLMRPPSHRGMVLFRVGVKRSLASGSTARPLTRIARVGTADQEPGHTHGSGQQCDGAALLQGTLGGEVERHRFPGEGDDYRLQRDRDDVRPVHVRERHLD